MLFNSFDFAVFFPVVTALYFLLPHRWCSWLLLAASCLFYMAFIPAYILILGITIVVDYVAGIRIEKASGRARRQWLVWSIIVTCLVLIVFKYYNFTAENLGALARLIGWNYSIAALGIVLPIGLSFHTFQSLSYVIEVYRGHLPAERRFGVYALYVMFFPQLVAGPIERPQNLLWQFDVEHRFDYHRVTSGLRLMAWGLFKKIVIADRLALYVNEVYGGVDRFGGLQLVTATVFFALQIYCDFSGYSDIAIGSARVLGFHLMKNFDRPYASRSVGEFWRRWHISLSTWFKDYVYVSLGGNRVSAGRRYRNLAVTFLLSGFWHGANWTFVAWGGLNGVYLIVGDATRGARTRARRRVGLADDSPLTRLLQTATTFALICVSWVFFRAVSIDHAVEILVRSVTTFGAAGLDPLAGITRFTRLDLLVVSGAFLVLEAGQYAQAHKDLGQRVAGLPRPVRWAGYYAMLFVLLWFGIHGATDFIYFQF